MRVVLVLVGLLSAALFVAPVAAQHPHSPPGPEAEERGRVFELSIQDQKLTGDDNVLRVTQGETVTLRWTSDEATSIHLHGYDIEKQVKPEASVVFTFKAHATGRFPIAAHGLSGPAHGEETILLYLEVHPQ